MADPKAGFNIKKKMLCMVIRRLGVKDCPGVEILVPGVHRVITARQVS